MILADIALPPKLLKTIKKKQFKIVLKKIIIQNNVNCLKFNLVYVY